MGKLLQEQFKNLVAEIKHKEFREAVNILLGTAPDYIMICPASSTGKYHPQDEIGEDGMIKHINRCATIAKELVRMHDWGTYENDILIAAALLHDSFKQGLETDEIKEFKIGKIKMPKVKHTMKYHPTYIFRRVSTITKQYANVTTVKMLWDLAHVCLFHEGRWTIEASKELAQKDKFNGMTSELCKTMHTVDVIASRRTIADEFQYGSLPQEH